jgi:hypothetical protein
MISNNGINNFSKPSIPIGKKCLIITLILLDAQRAQEKSTRQTV